MAKRYPRNSRVYLLVLLAIGLLWVLLGCHIHYHEAQQGPEYHIFGTINKCPQEQADELERDERWDAWENDDAPTDAE